MTTAHVLVAALVLDALMGEPRWLWSRLPHPAVLAGRFIGGADARFNDNTRTAGVALVSVLVGVALVLGVFLMQLGWLAEALAAAILLAHRSLDQHVRRVADDLRQSLAAGRRAVARIVSRDCTAMSEADVSRAAIESAAENLSDGVIAPAFWFLIGGLPAMLVYKAVNTADSMIGYRTPRHENFGWAAARVDDVLNWVPARLTAALFWIAGGLQGRWSGIAAEAARHKSPNAGWPEAALSRGLGVALAGPRSYHGALQDLPWVNPAGRRQIGPAEIGAAVGALWRVWWLFVMIALVLGFL